MYHILKSDLNGLSESDDFLSPLIIQIAAQMVLSGRRSITRNDLVKLEDWTEYGIPPVRVINLLVKEGLLHNSTYDENEHYFFAYDQMNDYYCAKAILNMFKEKKIVREYLANHVLKIENGELRNSGNIDLFVNACALYAKKCGEECIDIIDSLQDGYDQLEVFSRYTNSFQWRNVDSINKELFYSLMNAAPKIFGRCSLEIVLRFIIR